MKAVFFYIFYGFVWLITLLPMPVLYLKSDFAFFIVYHVLKYRKKVVLNNLHNAFPEKDETEINIIAKRFYRHFCDIFIESVKTIHITKKQVNRRYRFQNPEVFNELYDRNKGVILVSGHYGNWEWMINFPAFVKHKFLVIYKPLKSKYFTNFINNLREKFGAEMITMKESYKIIMQCHKENHPAITWFLADQSPPKEARYWTTFLNQDTPVFLGPEKISVKTGHAVVYMEVLKVKRGVYDITFTKITEDSKNTAPNEITEKHVKLLEQSIQRNPQYWLWSHRRWKYKKYAKK